MKLKFLLLSILSGLLLYFGWPTNSTTMLLFFAFAPLLYIEDELSKSGRKGFWLYSLLALLIWNLLTTWWVGNATPGGGATAVVANSLLMSLPLLAFKKTKAVYPKLAYLSLIVYWIGFEYLHLNWDISWPWLTLGNAFSQKTWWVQWYEYTGILGGSIWVWLVNIVVFKQIQFIKGRISLPLIRIAIAIALPMGLSFWIGGHVDEDGERIKVAAVQPSIDPYKEKFYSSPEQQVDKMIEMTEKTLASEKDVDIVLWPETAIQGNNQEKAVPYNPLLGKILNLGKTYPDKAFLLGMESWEFVPEGSNPAYTHKGKAGSYQYFNTGFWLQEEEYDFYHKSRFVPGAEMLPFPKVMGFMLSIINFARAGAYAPQDTRPVYSTRSGIKLAPVICYESIYGDYLSEYVRGGAAILTVITNDGWWHETEGHRQHNLYARLRAIEFRRPVVRSANTGISSFIDITGKEISNTKWYEKTVLVDEVRTSKKITFYASYGDSIGRAVAFFAIALLLSTFVRKKTEQYV